MERKEFLSTLGISLAAICAGCGIASCGSNPEAEDPKPSPTTGNTGGTITPPANALMTASLDTELRNIGEFKIASGVILVRLAAGNAASAFTAVQVACTHQGTSINYNNSQGKFICPNHGSQFSTSGAVLLGPATAALKSYAVNVTGNTLSVTA
jgi:cytochrome b6-f complex iron-sulfur subunit